MSSKWTPWIIAAAVVGVVLYMRRGDAQLANLIAGGSITRGPNAALLDQANAKPSSAQQQAAEMIEKAKMFVAAVKSDHALGAALGISENDVGRILSDPSTNR